MGLLGRRGQLELPVSNEIRVVESEIDSEIRSLSVWKSARAIVLKGIMGIYRDLIELGFFEALDANVFDSNSDLLEAFKHEDRIRCGVLWALKWATEYCPRAGRNNSISKEGLLETVLLGQTYDVFVDVLKYAENDLVKLSAVRESKEIICYEGKNLTGFDLDIVEYQQTHRPTSFQAALTNDSDQLTSHWNAGDYRKVIRQLAKYSSAQERQIVVDPKYLAMLGKKHASVSQPTLVWLNRPQDEVDSYVFNSLTLPSVMDESVKWNARSFLETPIVNVENKFCALSSDLKAVACVDDYMLRLAARVDPTQYSSVSGLREDRMIDTCKAAFESESNPWKFRCRFRLNDPPQEGDISVSRSSDSFVIELKSTLRPETPWEVYKRNCGLLEGISQAVALVRRGVARRGLVITDGYRGDYRCWEKALRYDVPIGTLFEVNELAQDPNVAVELMKRRAGVAVAEKTERRMRDRKACLLGWTLRLVDSGAE